jgi:cation diffusion facilitator CzcD-associated flavoprotein CzcO
MPEHHFDVIIIGAGLSGIAAAYHLQAACPNKSYAIIEARDAIGGTWDLFRYPGIRSDSDMYTFGYPFRPWVSDKAIADGPSIRDYIRATAAEFGIDRNIRFGHRVTRLAWSPADARWSVEVTRAAAGSDPAPEIFTCHFLCACTGYYDYASGYLPDFPGVANFKGPLIQPQHWPEHLDYRDKKVIVIGSGATAVTLVPSLAAQASHVTMLQRSPTYIVARPERDKVATFLRRYLPTRPAFTLARWFNVLFGIYFYNLCRRTPEAVKNWIVAQVRAALGDGCDVATHFTPRYDPWDQRLCLARDGDFFKAIRDGRADVVTDEIASFTGNGVALRSGRNLDADIVVAATGLKMQLLGGIAVTIGGKPVTFSDTMNYRGTMFSDVPNFAATVGYTNASWTLKADLTSAYVARLINYMDRHGYVSATPRQRDPSVQPEPLIDFSSGYIQRAIAEFPRQGSKRPWKLYQNYVRDLISLRFGAIADPALEFARASRRD